jgi:hypothetical protein
LIAPTGELLFFAWPKKSNQKKGHPLPLYPALRLFSRGLSKGASSHMDVANAEIAGAYFCHAPSTTGGIHAATLRAIPN